MLQRRGNAQQVAGLQGSADAARDLVGQSGAEGLLLLQLHMPARYRTQCHQGKTYQKAEASGHQGQLLAQAGVVESVAQAGRIVLVLLRASINQTGVTVAGIPGCCGRAHSTPPGEGLEYRLSIAPGRACSIFSLSPSPAKTSPG